MCSINVFNTYVYHIVIVIDLLVYSTNIFPVVDRLYTQ